MHDLEKQYGTSSRLYQALCIISEPWVNSNCSYSPETPISGQNRCFFVPSDLEIWWMTLKNNRTPFLCYFKLCASLHSHWSHQTEVTVRKHQIQVKISDFLSHVILKCDRWPLKTIGHLFYATSSFVHHFISIGQLKLELQSIKKFGQNQHFFVPCDLEIWRMTFKNNMAPLLYYFLHHFIAICEFTLELRSKNIEIEFWPLTLTFCKDITSVNGNHSWKMHDDMMMGT